MDFSPSINPEQKRIAIRNDAVGMGFDAYTVAEWIARLPPQDAV